nr:putative reverse transcriptase domain-containing protein [Tanacetum cinerariifolium]
MIIKKDSEIVKAKVERKSLALKARKESSDEDYLTFGSEDEEYVMAVRDFRKFFKIRGIFARDKKTFQRSRDDKNSKSDINALDAATRIILLENVQNHRKTRTKEHLSEANVVADAISRKERVNPKRVRAMNMIPHSSIKDRILAAQREKDSKIVKAKVERKSLALKARKESSDEECLTFGSEDEEYVMAVRDYRKFFKRRGIFARDKKTFQRSRDDKNEPPKDENQRAFVRGSMSDSSGEDDEKVNNETCLIAQASSE